VNGQFVWAQRKPADQEITDIERREIWYICKGYLIHAPDKKTFMQWAKSVDFGNKLLPEPPVVYSMFLGEQGWSSASRYFDDAGWIQLHDCPVEVQVVSFEYLAERGGFDCSLDDSYTLRLPTSQLINGLNIQWSGDRADYNNSTGQLAVFDPDAHDKGPIAHLFREDLLKEFLGREGLLLCWTVLGGKEVIGAGPHRENNFSLRITGAFILSDNDPEGFLKYIDEI
jgi:hypothetical protein